MPYSNCKIIALHDDAGKSCIVYGVEIGKIDSFFDAKTKQNVSMSIFMGEGKFYASVTTHSQTEADKSASRLVVSENNIKKLVKIIGKKYVHHDLNHMLAEAVKNSNTAVARF
jgi:hypothetical protein